MTEPAFPILSFIIFILAAGAGLIWLVPNPRQARWVALFTVLLDLALTIVVVLQFDHQARGFQWVERLPWIPTLHIDYMLGVDGISVLFLPFTALLFAAVLLASWASIHTLPRLYYSLLLLLESATLGIFCALDTLLFFLFWELTLIPTFFLISLWGIGPQRRYAAVKYTLMMLAGGVPLLFGFLVLAFGHAEQSGALVFDYPTLLQTSLPMETQVVVFFLLLLGFAVKIPIFPFHTWLPTVAMEGPAAISAIMTGLKLGAYGLIRFTVPMAPNAAQEFHWFLTGIGVIAVLYGALVAFSQTNLRRLLAFASLSHVGLVLLGIASFTLQGIQGALYQLINFTVIASGLFLLVGFLHHRIGSTDLLSLGGVAHSMPLLAAFYLFFGLASMGVPGSSGFPAELLLMISILDTHVGAGLAALLGVVLGGAYFLSLYGRTMLGVTRYRPVATAMDLRPRELLIVMVLSGCILAGGLYPNGVLEITHVAGETWIHHVNGD